jgi:hypothetical protein
MFQTACGILYQNQDLKVNIHGEFDGLQTFERVDDLASKHDSFERLVLDFSDASRVRVLELFYLLNELAADARFEDAEISIEGLKGRCMI